MEKKLTDFKAIVGLGNPGNKFKKTRHNVGFMFLNMLADNNKLDWSNSKRFQSQIAKWNSTTLLKPQTYMNKSGIAVQIFCQKNGIKDFKSLLVIHDELDLPLGEFKLSFAKSSPSHNGVSSIEEKLGSDQFWRLRIGTENRELKEISGKEYVLQRFSQEELDKILAVFVKLQKVLL